mmetsp:Transcript_46814/g.114146  ORF Transcript_46814/g.114146 Transcript_46814/m.114146 type:complete len:807 (-) Transcript_46814:966-3386(-)
MLLNLATTKIAPAAVRRSVVVIPRSTASGRATNSSLWRCYSVFGGGGGRETASTRTTAVVDRIETAAVATVIETTNLQVKCTASPSDSGSSTTYAAALAAAAMAMAPAAAATAATHHQPFLTSCDAPTQPNENTPSSSSSSSSTSKDFEGNAVSSLREDRRDNGGDLQAVTTNTSSVAKSKSILRRMTNVGRFSLLSETRSNPSVPVMVLVVTDDRNGNDATSSSSKDGGSKSGSGSFNAEDFIRLYEQRGIATKHPRFNARLDPTGSYFVHHDDNDDDSSGDDDDENHSSVSTVTKKQKTSSPTVDVVVRDVSYPVGGRAELVQWINQALLTPIPLDETLWDVQVATGGTLGRSGAINPHRLDEIVRDQNHNNNNNNKTTNQGCGGTSTIVESLIVFRSHHCLADGVSLGAVFGDFMDEGPQIKEMIEQKVNEYYASKKNKKRKNKGGGIMSWLKKFLKQLSMLLYYWFWGTVKAFSYHFYLIMESFILHDPRTNPWTVLKQAYDERRRRRDDVTEKEKDFDDDEFDRYAKKLAWGYVATVDEVKQVANYYSQQQDHGEHISGTGSGRRKSRVTVNDIFCSCVSAAIIKLLKYHQTVDPSLPLMYLRSMNLVMPVHMQGGILLPGQSLGNKIGALVTQIPGEMEESKQQLQLSAGKDIKLSLLKSQGDLAQERLLNVHRELQARKQTPAAVWSYVIANIMGALGTKRDDSWIPSLFQKASANASVVVTNVRGPEHTVHLDGRPVQSFLGFLPLPPGIPVGMVVGSYNGEVQLAVSAEQYAVPDADRFLNWVIDEYKILKDHAGVP